MGKLGFYGKNDHLSGFLGSEGGFFEKFDMGNLRGALK